MNSDSNRSVKLNAQLIKNMRKEKALSQEDLSYECLEHKFPVSISSIKRAELGMRVSYRTARNISLYFEVLPCELIVN